MNTQKFIFSSEKKDINTVECTYKTPSNIALVKYWGKTNPQIPKNQSISFTLSNCHTITTIKFEKKVSGSVEFDFFFEGKRKDDFKPKLAKFFDRIHLYCSYLSDYRMVIYSENSFPHSSGIASSASGLSAIAMCLMDLERTLNPQVSDTFFKQKASFLARLGSGSASRSIEGPLVVWGAHSDIEGSSDLYGVTFSDKVNSVFENYQDTILLVDKGKKQVSSTLGHNLMNNHPFAENRFVQADENITKITRILKEGNLKEFINLVESEALTLHAMMMTSEPYFILMKPNTLQIINKIWEYRNANDSSVCFTLDAGANVHVLYPCNEKKSIQKFIEEELSKYCQNGQYIHDVTGFGGQKI